MSKRPNIEGALKQVSSRYELVHAVQQKGLNSYSKRETIYLSGTR
jgi:DNA-directed RNA polymerase omega subunit